MDQKENAQTVIDQTDSLLAVLQRDIDATPAGALDGAEIHAVLTAARALLATGRA